ncbi:MAG: exodeoxyribonuclease VII small subunit [Candidatus Eisenbacteria bacterium]|jgi:exodeoxyribonuclease VII small subunit|nr:exodeoxyribonuclease VII small subunit [Candidatus Eisenbacteria bacterium]
MPGDTAEPVHMTEELQHFEVNLARLEEVVATLEKGGATLQRSLDLFEEGMALLARLHRVLELTESRIDELVRSAEGSLATRPFEPPR